MIGDSDDREQDERDSNDRGQIERGRRQRKQYSLWPKLDPFSAVVSFLLNVPPCLLFFWVSSTMLLSPFSTLKVLALRTLLNDYCCERRYINQEI